MSKHPLVAAATQYVERLLPSNNEFGDGEAFLSRTPFSARTKCSSFIRLLLNQVYDINPVVWVGLFQTMKPNARAFYHAARMRMIPTNQGYMHQVIPGDLGFICYDENRNGFSGHAFLVCGEPHKTDRISESGLEEWIVPVIDSSRTSHGIGDTRYNQATGEQSGGIGQGFMRFLTRSVRVDGFTEALDEIRGYKWKGVGNSEESLLGKGQNLITASVPREWPLRQVGKESSHG